MYTIVVDGNVSSNVSNLSQKVERKMKKIIKLFLTVCIVSVCSSFCFADTKTDALNELSRFKINVNYTNGFPLYNMNDFSKSSVGANLGCEFALFQTLLKNTDFGFYGRASFQNFIPYSLQLDKLCSYSFSAGIYGEYFLPQDISIAYSLGAGFLISEIKFLSSEKGIIDDVYYDFMLESDLSVRKVMLDFDKVNVLLCTGCHFAFYHEKTESFLTLGPTVGLKIDFKLGNSRGTGK